METGPNCKQIRVLLLTEASQGAPGSLGTMGTQRENPSKCSIGSNLSNLTPVKGLGFRV